MILQIMSKMLNWGSNGWNHRNSGWPGELHNLITSSQKLVASSGSTAVTAYWSTECRLHQYELEPVPTSIVDNKNNILELQTQKWKSLFGSPVCLMLILWTIHWPTNVLIFSKKKYINYYILDRQNPATPACCTMGTTATTLRMEHVTMMLFTNIQESSH